MMADEPKVMTMTKTHAKTKTKTEGAGVEVLTLSKAICDAVGLQLSGVNPSCFKL